MLLDVVVQLPVEHRDVQAAGVRLHVALAGPEDGPAALLLHGFPECWACWRHQIPALAAAGVRVIAPDQRGYNLSERPRSLSAYRLDRLAADGAVLLDALAVERAVVVGHDWGGMVAWWMALAHADRTAALVACNIPHPVVMRRFLWRDRGQRRRSRYIFAFQLPWLPERQLAANDYAQLVRALVATSRPGTFADDLLELYREAWARPRALTGMLAWYRAALRRPPPRRESYRVEVPTTIVWGAGDRFLGVAMVESSLAMCRLGRAEVVEDATHWIQHEEPELVTREILAAAEAL